MKHLSLHREQAKMSEDRQRGTRRIGQEYILMQEFTCVTGMVLKQTPIGEYDRRICLLTKEKGKISAFARGARKPGNRLTAATNPFSFGIFKLYAGRDSYTVSEADIRNYFSELMTDYVGAYYGMYFAPDAPAST